MGFDGFFEDILPDLVPVHHLAVLQHLLPGLLFQPLRPVLEVAGAAVFDDAGVFFHRLIGDDHLVFHPAGIHPDDVNPVPRHQDGGAGMGDFIGVTQLHPVCRQQVRHCVPLHAVEVPVHPVHRKAHLEGVLDGNLSKAARGGGGILHPVQGADGKGFILQNLLVVLLPCDGDGGAVLIHNVHHMVQVEGGEADSEKGHRGNSHRGSGAEHTAQKDLQGAEEHPQASVLQNFGHSCSLQGCFLGTLPGLRAGA